MRQEWLIYAALSALAASLVSVLGKIGMKEVDSTLATTVRSVMMTLFLLGVSAFSGVWTKVRSLSAMPLTMILLSAIAGAMSWLWMFKALASPGGDVSRVGPIDKLSMPLGILLAVLMLGERPSLINWAGIGLIVAGAYLASIKG